MIQRLILANYRCAIAKIIDLAYDALWVVMSCDRSNSCCQVDIHILHTFSHFTFCDFKIFIMPKWISQVKKTACNFYIPALLKRTLSISRSIKPAVFNFYSYTSIKCSFLIKYLIFKKSIHVHL